MPLGIYLRNTETMFDDKEKWTQFKVPVHTDEWYQFRTTGTEYYEGGIGASEISKFIGRNFYSPVAPEVFYQKIGVSSPDRIYNDAIHWGIVMEPFIKEVWQYEDLRKDGGYSKNMLNFQNTGDLSFKIREQVDVPFYLINNKYPWLFASLDGAIKPGQKMIDPNRPYFLKENDQYVLTDRYCPLEVKNMAYYSLKQWEGEMDPGYIAQVHQQMIVSESYYGEIVVLVDGRRLKIFPIYLHSGLAEQILETSYNVWHHKVLPGRELVKEYKHLLMQGKREAANKVWANIQSLEPEVRAGEAYTEWLKRSIKDTGERRFGSLQHYAKAQRLKRLKAIKRLLEDEISEGENQLLDDMRKNNLAQIDLGKDKRITYNSNTRRLTISGIKTPLVDKNVIDKL